MSRGGSAPKTAVADVSFRVEPGTFVGVIGRSGAGKSTLLRMINRLIDPSEGRILFHDTDVSALRGRELRQWRARSAMIFQQFNLVPRLDVLTNTLLGRIGQHRTIPSLFKRFTAAERALAIETLERFDLVAHAFQRAETLSGGQQQRVAIARALMQEPVAVNRRGLFSSRIGAINSRSLGRGATPTTTAARRARDCPGSRAAFGASQPHRPP